LDKEELKFPKWLEDSKERGRLKVTFGENSEEELKVIVSQGSLDFYKDFNEVKDLIREVFELNPHSIHTINKHVRKVDRCNSFLLL
jgi:Asp-tRNA(Asn)/Glu-tRNA(Gln) amidotransferase B subunit